MITEEQLAKHNKCITGSKVASILNLPDAYQSKYELFAQMKGYTEPDKEATERMKAGNYMELGIEAWCRGEWGWKLKKGPKDGMTHPQHDFIWGLIDRLRTENGSPAAVTEFKNVDRFMQPLWEDGPPDKFKTQTYLYMAIYDLPGVIVPCFGGNHFEKYELPRNPQVENYIIKKCCEFWDDLQNDKWPDVDDSKSCEETLKKLYPDHNKNMVAGTEEQLQLAIEYEKAKAEVKKAEEKKSELGNKLKDAIGDNEGILFAGGKDKATWKKTNPKKVKFNEEQFEREDPETYKRYLYLPPGHRTLRISVKGVEL